MMPKPTKPGRALVAEPNYWVIKGRPSINDFERWLKPGRPDEWGTKRPPRKWTKGDRLFFWRTSPLLDIVGLGEFRGLQPPSSKYDDTRFGVRYLCPMLCRSVGIEVLRSNRILNGASFLKAGPSGTVFPLTPPQGQHLYQIICRQNPFVEEVWPDVLKAPAKLRTILDVDLLDLSAEEGERRLFSHLSSERARSIVEAKKRNVLAETGTLVCEVCRFDFAKTYGALGRGFCEVHHRKPLALGNGIRITSLRELAIVCSNCHRMLHRMRGKMSIEELTKILVRTVRTA